MSTPIFEPGIHPAFERRSPPRAEKATAVVLFIGHTEKRPPEGRRKIRSMKEYVDSFGRDPASHHAYATLHHAIQLYFDNDGTACYVHSLGTWAAENDPGEFRLPLQTFLQHAPDVTLISLPAIGDLCRKQDTLPPINRAATICPEKWATLYCALLEQVSASKQVFLLIDLPETETDAQLCLTALQKQCSNDAVLGAAACYWPRIISNRLAAEEDGRQTASPTCVSGAVAALMQKVDREQGVWSAPANQAIAHAITPQHDELQGSRLFSNETALSVNRIRSFPGRGVRVWGCRTLMPKNRLLPRSYVQTARLLSYVESSLSEISRFAVFEPNNEISWLKLKSLTRVWLRKLWLDGALFGRVEEDAFAVSLGLNETMTTADIQSGRLIVKIHLALHAPTEFVSLIFSLQVGDSHSTRTPTPIFSGGSA